MAKEIPDTEEGDGAEETPTEQEGRKMLYEVISSIDLSFLQKRIIILSFLLPTYGKKDGRETTRMRKAVDKLDMGPGQGLPTEKQIAEVMGIKVERLRKEKEKALGRIGPALAEKLHSQNLKT